jgi:hypothetical protein
MPTGFAALSLFILIAITYVASNISVIGLFPWFVVIYVERIYSKIVVGESRYSVGKKYCRIIVE